MHENISFALHQLLIFPANNLMICRQYNRKKKAEPGTMCEDDMERVEGIENIFPATLPKHDAENGETVDESPDTPLQDLDEEVKKKPLVKLKAKTPAKVKPSKTLLQFSKKKRKRSDSEGSDADLDRTPPPSPPEEESGIEKRRSGRNTKRKKYTDDVTGFISDDEGKDREGQASAKDIEEALAPIDGPVDESAENSNAAEDAGSGPNYAFVDPTAEDSMIVQIILASRTGTREVAEEEEEDVAGDKKEEPVKEETKEEEENKVNGESETKEEESKDDKENNKPKEEEDSKKEDEDVKEEKEEKVEEKTSEEQEKKEEAQTDETKESPSKSAAPKPEKPEKKNVKTVEVEEFLVKFKNFSYLHCQWLTEEELLRGDKRVTAKIKRYLQKKDKSANMMDFCDDEPFNPDYVEVDRVLDSSVHTETDTNVSIENISEYCQIPSLVTSEADNF